MEDRRRLAVKRCAGRCWLACMLAGIVATVGWAAWLSRPYLKAATYDYRIRHGNFYDAEANMIALGRLQHEAGTAVLDKYACAIDPQDHWATLATWALCKYYPGSRVARGVKDYKTIMGRERPWDASKTRSIDKARLRAWIEKYEPHPSTDDAYLVLARETERTDPIEALRLLHIGFHSPDGDAHDEIANRFQMTLERRSTADQLEGWLRSDCPAHVASNVAYVAGIKRMREGRYRDAIPLLEQFATSLATDQPELRGDPNPAGQHYGGGSWGKWVTSPEQRWQLARRQLDECRWFAQQEDALESEPDREARAAILHAMARRSFHSRDLFINCFYYEMVFTEDAESCHEGAIGLVDISLDNNYRQAAELFLRIARDYPTYSDREAVDYSIPLCLWRVRTTYPTGVSARLDQAIYCGFQAFADQYPSSSMADDALYLAGIYHWMSTDLDACRAAVGRDTTVLEANMRRIACDYASGDVIQRYGQTNPWLRLALLRRRYELDPGAATADMAGIIAQLRAWGQVWKTVTDRRSQVASRPATRNSEILRE